MADRIIALAAAVLAAWAVMIGAAGLAHDLTRAASGWPGGICDTPACWRG